MDKEKIAAFLEGLIDSLTFTRVALLALLASIVISLLSVYENRTAIFSEFFKKARPDVVLRWDLSNESKAQLKNLTANDLIGAISFVDVDLKKNRRLTKFFFLDDPADMAVAEKVITNELPQALFDYDKVNTAQMVAMLNNEFLCVPTATTTNVKLFPTLISKYPVQCRLAVPPFFGEFAGYVAVFLRRQPEPNEVDGIRIELNRLAIEIYLRDIAKKPVM